MEKQFELNELRKWILFKTRLSGLHFFFKGERSLLHIYIRGEFQEMGAASGICLFHLRDEERYFQL